MTCFRKRKQKIISSSRCDAHFVTKLVGETTYVSQVFEPVAEEHKLAELSPTLDQMLNAGVSPKEVNVNGLLDSYDVNDTPLQAFEEKIVTKGRKAMENVELNEEN